MWQHQLPCFKLCDEKKISVYDKIVIKKLEKPDTSKKFYMNFHLRDNLRMELIVYSNEMMLKEALT